MINEIIIRTVTGICFAAVILITLLALPAWCFALLMAIVALFIAFVELPRLVPIISLRYWLLLFVYILFPFFSMALINYHQIGHQYIILLFLIAFAHDTTALIFGKIFGRHKLISQISPNKTWEGFFGGFLGVLLILSIYRYSFSEKIIYFIGNIFFAIIFTIIATLGDLFESWLKRRANLKDASSMLPGHGGLLDRFDSIIFLWGFFLIKFMIIYFLYV